MGLDGVVEHLLDAETGEQIFVWWSAEKLVPGGMKGNRGRVMVEGVWTAAFDDRFGNRHEWADVSLRHAIWRVLHDAHVVHVSQGPGDHPQAAALVHSPHPCRDDGGKEHPWDPDVIVKQLRANHRDLRE